MVMTNGIGAYLGGFFSGWVVDHFTVNGVKDWQSIWFTFAGYALTLGLIFPFIFKYKHNPSDNEIRKGEAVEMTWKYMYQVMEDRIILLPIKNPAIN